MRVGFLLLIIQSFSGLYLAGQPAISPKLLLQSETFRKSNSRFTIQVENLNAFREKYPEIQIQYEHRLSGSLVVIARDGYSQFLNDSTIRFIDIPGKPVDESVLGSVNFHYNRIRAAQFPFSHKWGEPIKVSVKEQAFDGQDIDLTGRSSFPAISSSVVSQHATQMATIIGGAGNYLQAGMGVVPFANLTSSDYSNLLPDGEEFLEGVHVQNHSYGVNVENYYGVEAVAYDAGVFANPQILHVFSSGNFGSVAPESGIYAGLQYANLSGTFKQAKNVLVINAVDTTYRVNIRNSVGPAYDGRLKPELTAYGAGGTSEAAALASGAAAFINHLYRTQENKLPPASLLKAILIAGADDIGNPGPDFKTGYGSLNLSNSREIVESGYFEVIESLAETTVPISIEVPANTQLLRVVTVWHEPAADVNSNKALLHDLETRIISAGTHFLPWVLSPYPDTDSLDARAVRRKDHLNNVEFITVDNPAAGDYTLEIRIPQLTTETQQVGIAWYLEEQDLFEWDYPYDSCKLHAGEKVDLYWKNTFDLAGSLDIKIGSNEWMTVADNLDLNSGYRITMPNTTAVCRLRMMVGTEAFESGPFMITRKIDPDFSFVCDKELGFIWGKLSQAEVYNVYQMGEQNMEIIDQTTDTSKLMVKSGSPYYSVAPVIDGWEGPRSLALDYSFSGTFCFFDFFQASKDLAGKVVVRLDLSTLSQIEKVVIKKFHSGVEYVLADFVPSQVSNEIIDPGPNPGRNLYWATIRFQGSMNEFDLSSDTTELYLEDPGRLVLFPNPANEMSLNILSDGTGQLMKIYDQNGKFLFQKELFYTYDEIVIYDLQPGNYFYRLYEFDEEIDQGRFVKY